MSRLIARAPLRIDFGGGWTDVPLFSEQEGGAVLNAAITPYVRGSLGRGRFSLFHADRNTVQYSVDAPVGSGLGTSASQTVVWVALIRAASGNTAERMEVAEISCRIAADLGIVGGKQDEYASALGGFHYFTFGERVGVTRLDLDSDFQEALRRRLVLVYSGANRLSSEVHHRVWERYRQGEPVVVDALRTMRRLAGEMREALEQRNLTAFGHLLGEHWEAQKRLDVSVAGHDLDEVVRVARRHGALGGKACGAGGGGFLVLLTEEGAVSRVSSALAAIGLRSMDFAFDSFGVRVTSGGRTL